MDNQGKILEQSEAPTPMTSLDDYLQTLVGLYHHYENENIEAESLSTETPLIVTSMQPVHITNTGAVNWGESVMEIVHEN